VVIGFSGTVNANLFHPAISRPFLIDRRIHSGYRYAMPRLTRRTSHRGLPAARKSRVVAQDDTRNFGLEEIPARQTALDASSRL
jgi:hypothetical protein